MAEEQEQEQQVDENKRIRPRERARGQKYMGVFSDQFVPLMSIWCQN